MADFGLIHAFLTAVMELYSSRLLDSGNLRIGRVEQHLRLSVSDSSGIYCQPCDVTIAVGSIDQACVSVRRTHRPNSQGIVARARSVRPLLG